MIIQIEIGKGWKKGFYSIRFGDINGATSLINIPLDEVLAEIKDAVNEEVKREEEGG